MRHDEVGDRGSRHHSNQSWFLTLSSCFCFCLLIDWSGTSCSNTFLDRRRLALHLCSLQRIVLYEYSLCAEGVMVARGEFSIDFAKGIIDTITLSIILLVNLRLYRHGWFWIFLLGVDIWCFSHSNIFNFDLQSGYRYDTSTGRLTSLPVSYDNF